MNKKTWIVIGVVAVLLLGWKLWYKGGVWPKEGAMQESEEMEDVGPTESQLRSGTAVQAKTYTQLTAQYANRRIQFDMGCQAIPNNITYKSGTSVMFDNRSGDARLIKIGNLTYSFPGYGWKIITLRSSTLPKTLLLSCGAAVNVGQILLQK